MIKMSASFTAISLVAVIGVCSTFIGAASGVIPCLISGHGHMVRARKPVRFDGDIDAGIIGGSEVPDGTAPWMVSIQTTEYTKPMHVCGGVLVAPQWVLTAAHCVCSAHTSDLLVVAGEQHLFSYDGTEVTVRVSHVEIFKDFRPLTRTNDIALVKLNCALEMTANVQTITFQQSQGPQVDEWCDVYGWGAITEDGSIEDELSKSSQQVYSSEDCVRSYPGLIHEGMMCAGDAEAGSGPCQGDWGGPLVCRSNELFGIASWSAGCGSGSHPTVYANTSVYWDWIEATISSHFHYPSTQKCPQK